MFLPTHPVRRIPFGLFFYAKPHYPKHELRFELRFYISLRLDFSDDVFNAA